MLGERIIKPARPPVRDEGISSLITERPALAKTIETPVDKRFVRAFASFPNSSFPFQTLLKSYIDWAQQFLVDPRDVIFVTYSCLIKSHPLLIRCCRPVKFVPAV
jgi:hypothetical protein